MQATVESSSFPFLGGIGRFVPNPRLADLTDKLDKLRDEFHDATLDFVAGNTRRCVKPRWPNGAKPPNTSTAAPNV